MARKATVSSEPLDEAPEEVDVLTQVEQSKYNLLRDQLGNLLRAEAGQAMTVSDALDSLSELRKQSRAKSGEITAIVGRIAKARGREIGEVKDIDAVSGELRWKDPVA